jgi:hypothetical protein
MPLARVDGGSSTHGLAVNPVLSLAVRWRAEAERLRRYGADAQGKTLEACAAELESLAREVGERAVTLREAQELSGFSYSALEKMVRRGRLPNAGTKRRPRLRVADLPRKAGAPPIEAGPDLADRVLAASPAMSHIP